MVFSSLNDIIKKLAKGFLSVHRGYIINAKHLQQIEGVSLMVNNDVFPIGKKYRQEILNKINFI